MERKGLNRTNRGSGKKSYTQDQMKEILKGEGKIFHRRRRSYKSLECGGEKRKTRPFFNSSMDLRKRLKALLPWKRGVNSQGHKATGERKKQNCRAAEELNTVLVGTGDSQTHKN